MRRLPVALLATCLAVGGCGWEPPSRPELGPSLASTVTPTPSPTPTSPVLVTVETIGGECPTGPCDRLVDVVADGRLHELVPKDRTVGHAPPELIDALQVAIDRADFQLIRSRPFTGTCPTAVDGQELIYTFHLATRDDEIRTCTVAIDPNDPLFRALSAVLATEAP